MDTVLHDWGVELPVLAAPMAGGPTTTSLVISAAQAGALGFVAAGYLSAQTLADQLCQVRAVTSTFGVNLFAPNPVPVDRAEFDAYAARLQPEAEVYGIDLRGAVAIEDDDDWHAKIEILLATPVPVVSFTFGVPEASVIDALRAVGTTVLQTVTSPAEAMHASTCGVDALIVQATAAGGHSGTLTPSVLPDAVPLPALVAAVRAVCASPIIAAGGIATPTDVAEAIHAGADAVAVGTLLLRCPQAGTSAPYRAALADPARTATVLTRAFTGRPARALRNGFTDRHSEGAPSGYPAVHHLTRPVRKAAAEAGDPERLNLWAGTGWRHGTTEPVADVLRGLAAAL